VAYLFDIRKSKCPVFSIPVFLTTDYTLEQRLQNPQNERSLFGGFNFVSTFAALSLPEAQAAGLRLHKFNEEDIPPRLVVWLSTR